MVVKRFNTPVCRTGIRGFKSPPCLKKFLGGWLSGRAVGTISGTILRLTRYRMVLGGACQPDTDWYLARL